LLTHRLLFAVSAMVACAPAAASERLRLDYALYVGGFSAMNGSIDLSLTAGRYEVGLEAQTGGLIELVASWSTRAASRGALSGSQATAHEHEAVNLWRNQSRSVSMRYDAAGTVRVTALPAPQEDDRDPVAPELTRATLDPLSGFIAVMEGLRRGEGCGRTLATFDGRRRFDMRFRDLGRRALPAGSYSSFTGTAQHCVVDYIPVAGYKRSQERGVFWRGRGGDERPPINVWFAAVSSGGPPVPVRFETETPLGAVVVHLTSAGNPPR
jgi:hypothetical protein